MPAVPQAQWVEDQGLCLWIHFISLTWWEKSYVVVRFHFSSITSFWKWSPVQIFSVFLFPICLYPIMDMWTAFIASCNAIHLFIIQIFFKLSCKGPVYEIWSSGEIVNSNQRLTPPLIISKHYGGEHKIKMPPRFCFAEGDNIRNALCRTVCPGDSHEILV